MATKRDNPYGAFNFQVEFGDVAGGGPIDAGFSDVSGLGSEVNYSEYRNGTDDVQYRPQDPEHLQDRRDYPQARADRLDGHLYEWFKAVRDGQYQPRSVTIVMLDESP